MISLHLIPMDTKGNLIPREKWNRFHEWRGEDGRGFHSVNSALFYLKHSRSHTVFFTGLDSRAKVPAGNTLAATVNIDGTFYAALVGHFDDPADSTDYFEDAPIVAQDAHDGQGEGE